MLVLPGEEFFEQQAEQLQRNVLERQCRAMEQLEQPLLPVELDQRGHRGVGKTAIGLLANIPQFRLVERIADKRQHHPDRGFNVG